MTARSSPRTKPSPSTDVNPFVVWAAARARRQREQWQLWTRMKGSVTSYAMPPQRQLPRSAPDSTGSAAGGRSITGMSRRGGHSSNPGSSSAMVCQGAWWARKMWTTGRTPGSSAKSPAGTNHPPDGERSGREDPQTPQKDRRKPGEDS